MKNKYVMSFDEFVNESLSNNSNNYWKNEIAEFAYYLGEQNFDFDITYNASELEPYIVVNGIQFPISFMDGKTVDPETGIAPGGIDKTILIVHSSDDEDTGASYTIGSGENDIEEAYDFIYNAVA